MKIWRRRRNQLLRGGVFLDTDEESETLRQPVTPIISSPSLTFVRTSGTFSVPDQHLLLYRSGESSKWIWIKGGKGPIKICCKNCV